MIPSQWFYNNFQQYFTQMLSNNEALYSGQGGHSEMKKNQQILMQTQLNEHLENYLSIPITISTDKNQEEYEAFFSIDNKLLLKSPKRTYTLNPKSKIIANYDQTPKIQSITISNNGQNLRLSAKDERSLNRFYQKLRRQLSHRGFNDHFKPIKRLGRGSFAAVYLVQHKITNERYAAKVFLREGQKIGYMGQQSLQSEIHMLKTLKHPNIIRFWGIYETENLIYLITEYLSGGTLADFMRNKITFVGDFITKILADTLKALLYLQENNIMHRDLKPENIIMRESDKEWVLADFGLAAYTNQKYLYDKCGTMGFIAPQILAQNLEQRLYKSSCDLYSLGVVAYNLIIGCLPFKVEVTGMFDRKYTWDAFSKAQIMGLDEEILALLKGLLEKDPSRRWTSSQALASGLFSNPQVVERWREFNEKKIEQNYNKVLKLKNTTL